jgi:hypothetical protein
MEPQLAQKIGLHFKIGCKMIVGKPKEEKKQW